MWAIWIFQLLNIELPWEGRSVKSFEKLRLQSYMPKYTKISVLALKQAWNIWPFINDFKILLSKGKFLHQINKFSKEPQATVSERIASFTRNCVAGFTLVNLLNYFLYFLFVCLFFLFFCYFLYLLWFLVSLFLTSGA